jgi:hypothetical protein
MTYDDDTTAPDVSELPGAPRSGVLDGPADGDITGSGSGPESGAIDQPSLGAPDSSADPRGVGPDGSIDGGGMLDGTLDSGSGLGDIGSGQM